MAMARLKLSELMVKGCEGTEQIYCGTLLVRPHRSIRCCAMGAAFVGAYGRDEILKRLDFWSPGINEITGALRDYLGYDPDDVNDRKLRHPVTGLYQTVTDVVVNLNDMHEWSREQIAGYLRKEGL